MQHLLAGWKYKHVWVGAEVAGEIIDLLIRIEDQYFGIDLIGYPGDFEDAFGLNRYRILARANVLFFPIAYTDWYYHKEKIGEELKRFLEGEMMDAILLT